MTYKLMVKTHKVTGLKYLCSTQKEGLAYEKYKGSGKYWKEHLKVHGSDISTELIYEDANIDNFRSVAKARSIEWNIVNSENWANLKYEEGEGGSNYSQEVRERMGRIHKGKKLSEEHKAILDSYRRGRISSEETRHKMGSGKRGKPVSPESRKKMSIARKKYYELRK